MNNWCGGIVLLLVCVFVHANKMLIRRFDVMTSLPWSFLDLHAYKVSKPNIIPRIIEINKLEYESN